MEPEQRKLGLIIFTELLPEKVKIALLDKNIDILIVINEIGNMHGLVMGEVWWMYEGVRRIFSGEDTPQNLRSFLEPKLDADNRMKAGAIIEDLRWKLFIHVMPLLKEAGFKVTLPSMAPPAPAPASPPAATAATPTAPTAPTL